MYIRSYCLERWWSAASNVSSSWRPSRSPLRRSSRLPHAQDESSLVSPSSSPSSFPSLHPHSTALLLPPSPFPHVDSPPRPLSALAILAIPTVLQYLSTLLHLPNQPYHHETRSSGFSPPSYDPLSGISSVWIFSMSRTRTWPTLRTRVTLTSGTRLSTREISWCVKDSSTSWRCRPSFGDADLPSISERARLSLRASRLTRLAMANVRTTSQLRARSTNASRSSTTIRQLTGSSTVRGLLLRQLCAAR